MAVIIATFAIAARKRSLLWTLAAAAGVTALLFAVYVYLYVWTRIAGQIAESRARMSTLPASGSAR